MVHDGAMAALSLWLGLYLRLGAELWRWDPGELIQDTILFTLIVLVFLRLTRLDRGIWRYASMSDLMAIGRTATFSIVVYTLALFGLTRLEGQPRSTLVITWLVLMALLAGPRIAYRWYKDRRFNPIFERAPQNRPPVLLVGAGDEAELFLHHLRRDRHANFHVVGIVGLSDTRVGRAIHGVPVLGTIDAIGPIVDRLTDLDRRPTRLILTKEITDRTVMTSLVDQATALGLALARMPRVGELKSGMNDRIDIRPIAIEDLLGRPQRVLDRAAVTTMITGKRVLVTGAGGTIGSELVRQIAALGPACIILFDSSEYQLYLIDLDLSEQFRDLPRHACLGDIRDRARLGAVLGTFRPEIVFHAAALKHVPMVEANPAEGILTNCIGTRNLAEACRDANVATMVMISTDKAVHPTNIMGATKRIAESICQALDIEARRAARGTHYITVRFGNVLGSTGSVVPLFRRQLEAGGPLTVTHPKVERFFMTVREAVELVLQAATLGTGAAMPDGLDQGGIFVLEMGEPVRIADLARQMIRLAGFEPDRDIKIAFVGMRPGEKLYEELFHEREPPVPTGRDGILLARPRTVDYAFLAKILGELEEACSTQDRSRMLSLLAHLVPEFQHEGHKTLADQSASV